VPECRGATIDISMDETYIRKFSLDKGHACLLVYTRVVSGELKRLARLLMSSGVVVLLVRNMVDTDIANDMEDERPY